MSAAFAYIAVFSIGPLLLVLISIVGFVFGQRAVEGQLISQLGDVMGQETANSVQNMIAHLHSSQHGALALTIGVIGTLLGAAGLTNQLQSSFNTIFRAVTDPAAGIHSTIYVKLKNIALVIVGSIVIAASVAASTLITTLGKEIKSHIGMPPFGLEVINTVVSLLVFMFIMYLIYRVLPDVVIPRKVVLAAAAWVSVLFVIGKIVLGIIIGHNGTASAYGAAASVIVLLLWFYYTAQILLLGAEGIKVYGEKRMLEFPSKRYTLKRRSLDVNAKKDLRGRSLEAFTRGFKSKYKKD